MKFKVGQRVQIPSRFWNYCGSDKTATVVEVDVKCDDPFSISSRFIEKSWQNVGFIKNLHTKTYSPRSALGEILFGVKKVEE